MTAEENTANNEPAKIAQQTKREQHGIAGERKQNQVWTK
jgi:hypothetical protein